MHLDVSELRDLDRDLVKGAAKVEKTAPVIVAKTAQDITATAMIYAPVDTGFLEGSISAEIDGLVAVIGPTADYGGYVEDGTKNEDGTTRMTAQPYMEPAANDHEPTFGTAMTELGGSIL